MSTQANMLVQGAAMLDSARRLVASETVIYTRGAHSVSLEMTFTKPNREFFNADGMALVWLGEDGLISASDLIINSVATVPAKGDTVARILRDTTTATYEVQKPAANVDCFDFSDTPHMNMRIHMKQIG